MTKTYDIRGLTAFQALQRHRACGIVELVRPHYADRRGRQVPFDNEYDEVSGCLTTELELLDLETLSALLVALRRGTEPGASDE
jgi:hypothetical protein